MPFLESGANRKLLSDSSALFLNAGDYTLGVKALVRPPTRCRSIQARMSTSRNLQYLPRETRNPIHVATARPLIDAGHRHSEQLAMEKETSSECSNYLTSWFRTRNRNIILLARLVLFCFMHAGLSGYSAPNEQMGLNSIGIRRTRDYY